MITSNGNIGESGTVFRDAVVATAILDRLLLHSYVITISGGSGVSRESRFQILRIDRYDLPCRRSPEGDRQDHRRR